MKSFLQKPTYLSSMEIQNVSIAFISRFHFHYPPHSTEGVMFVCDSEDNKSYLRDTNETNLASRWKVFIKKTQITEQHGITEREYCVYLTFSFSLSTSFNRQEVKFVCDSKDNKSYLRDINKTIFASRWRVFMKKTHISQQHGKTEREYCVYLTFSFSLFT